MVAESHGLGSKQTARDRLACIRTAGRLLDPDPPLDLGSGCHPHTSYPVSRHSFLHLGLQLERCLDLPLHPNSWTNFEGCPSCVHYPPPVLLASLWGFRVHSSLPQLRGAQKHQSFDSRHYFIVFCGSCLLEWPGLEKNVVGCNPRNPSVPQVAWEPGVLQLHAELLCFHVGSQSLQWCGW